MTGSDRTSRALPPTCSSAERRRVLRGFSFVFDRGDDERNAPELLAARERLLELVRDLRPALQRYCPHGALFNGRDGNGVAAIEVDRARVVLIRDWR